ncbi:MAG: HEAT repeat domain-containing protein, partial [Candidatus Poribacteria bacterium]
RQIEPNPEIRRACISVLGTLKPESAIADLIAVMEDSVEVRGIRFQAGLTLSQIGQSAVQLLIDAFNRGDVGVKDIAASALGNIGGSKVRDVLIHILPTIEDPTIKLTVVDAIAKIGDRQSIDALQEEKMRLQKGSGLGTFLNELLAQLEAQSM